MEKITNKSALQYVIENCDIPTEIKEKFEKMIEAIEKKSSGERKPTERQLENRMLMEVLYNALSADTGMTISDVIKNVPEFSEMNTQRIVPMCKALETAGKVRKEMVKGRAYFYKVEG